MSTILKAENISKQYRLGLVGTGTLSDDLKRWWYGLRGKEDPFLKIGAVNERESKASEDYVWALKDINFEVKQGEVLGIIGKNGAGKSTLLKILSRVTSPTTGSIKGKGRIASLLEVGTGFHGELTGRENIFMNGAILGMTKWEIKNKLDEIIAFSGCEMYIDTPVKRYSSGMTVRLGFAVAAYLEPEVLVVDEVLAVGDAEFQKKAIGKMQDLSSGEGRTVLFVSHNMSSVRSLCSRSILLQNGVVKEEGQVDEVIETYLKTSQTLHPGLSIANFSNRQGNGEVRLENVRVYGNQISESPKSGGSISFEFRLINPKKYKQSEIQFDFRIDDNLGQRLLWFSTELKEIKEEIAPELLKFKMEICNLNSGVYFVTTYISVRNEVADWVQNGFCFSVDQGLFYKNAGHVIPSQSKILSNFDLELYA